MKAIKIIFAISVLAAAMSCSKELGLAHKYDNSESSKYYEYNLDTLHFTDCGNYSISERVTVFQPAGIPRQKLWFDAKISVIKPSWSDKFCTFWSADVSLMQPDCETPWIEENIQRMTWDMQVYCKDEDRTGLFNDGGTWFIGVHEIENEELVGFFHAESHWEGRPSAYKSMGVTYSKDHGKTWSEGECIIYGPDKRPAVGANDTRSYGNGDGCVVWNEERQSWICYYSGKCDSTGDYMICMAESQDRRGEAGTWKKWDGSKFSGAGVNPSTGLGAKNYCIDAIKQYHGGNPSVMWNTEKKKWIMVYHSWQKDIIYSESKDGIVWEAPIQMINHTMEPGGCMYPNLVSEQGDTVGGNEIRLYYAVDMVGSQRSLALRKLILK